VRDSERDAAAGDAGATAATAGDGAAGFIGQSAGDAR
jgi:hypothetical protein